MLTVLLAAALSIPVPYLMPKDNDVCIAMVCNYDSCACTYTVKGSWGNSVVVVNRY